MKNVTSRALLDIRDLVAKKLDMALEGECGDDGNDDVDVIGATRDEGQNVANRFAALRANANEDK